jgi:CRISPR/Cas system-associated exonuclease Cas4 (RecB family)
MKKLGAHAEYDLTITEDFKHTTSDNRDEAWCRGFADILLKDKANKEIVIIDIKTGRVRDYTGQLQLYVWLAHLIFPWAEKFYAGIWYVDHGEAVEKEYSRKYIEETLHPKWVDRAERMLSDRDFRAKPSTQACQYCYFRSDKEGECDAWKRA